MNILLGFLPFVVFAVLQHLGGPVVGLLGAALVSLINLGRDLLVRHRSPKLLEVASLSLFGGLALFTLVMHAAWSVLVVRFAVDAGLLCTVLFSLAIGKPFTLAYAKEQTPEAVWTKPAFIRTNFVISGAWATAFAVTLGADAVMAWFPALPMVVGVVVSIGSLAFALTVTVKYPEHVRRALS